MTNKTLLINIRDFKGITAKEAVELIMGSGNKYTIKMLSNDIVALGGHLPEKGSKKESYARIYIQTLLNFTAEQKLKKKQAQENLPANGETPTAEQKQNTTKKEESTMTQENKQQSVQQGVTKDELNQMLLQLVNRMDERVLNAISGQVTRTEELLANMENRIAELEAGKVQVAATQEQPVDPKVRAKELADAINKHYGAVVVTEFLPLEDLERYADRIKEEGTIPVTTNVPNQQNVQIDPNTVVYTADQINALEKIKNSGNKELYERMKTSYTNLNKTLGRTAGNILNGTADFIDDVGHKGVDGIADLLDNTIDTVKNLVIRATEFGAGASHDVIGVGRNVGHVIINGTVYTLETTANIGKK